VSIYARPNSVNSSLALVVIVNRPFRETGRGPGRAGIAAEYGIKPQSKVQSRGQRKEGRISLSCRLPGGSLKPGGFPRE
jgi:ribonuclease PH